MPHLNVEISEEAIQIAKECAARDGMLLRKWIERLIVGERKLPEPVTERVYVPEES